MGDGYSVPSIMVPSYRAGIRGQQRLPATLPGFDAGTDGTPTEPDPVTVPWYRAGLRGEWWKRAVGRGK